MYINIISHPSNILFRVILNRLKAAPVELLAEEQAGFRPGRSTVEQIFNSRIIIEKHLQHQRDLYHNFIDFKKAFDRVCHVGLWQVLRNFGIDEGMVQAIQPLYENSSSAVFLNSQLWELFNTTIGVSQECILSPVLFNLFLEKIMQKTLHDHHTSPLMEGPYATFDLPTTSILWVAAMMNFKTSPTDSWTEQRHTERTSAQKRARS